MDQPLEIILSPLPLTEHIKNALLRHEGSLGRALRATLAYEQGGAPEEIDATGLPFDILRNAYLEALIWSRETSKALF
ncbi:MAG: hypothetical protein M3A44_13640 [Gammaproteobacteria bacterium]